MDFKWSRRRKGESIFSFIFWIKESFLFRTYLLTCLSEQWTAVAKLPGGEALLPLVDCFNDVVLVIGVGLSQLTNIIKAGLRVKDLFSFFLSDSFRAGYER